MKYSWVFKEKFSVFALNVFYIIDHGEKKIIVWCFTTFWGFRGWIRTKVVKFHNFFFISKESFPKISFHLRVSLFWRFSCFVLQLFSFSACFCLGLFLQLKSFQLRKWLYIHKCPFVCLSSFIIHHPSSFIILHPSSPSATFNTFCLVHI